MGASVLKKTADRIERDEFDTGWYDVRDNVELDQQPRDLRAKTERAVARILLEQNGGRELALERARRRTLPADISISKLSRLEQLPVFAIPRAIELRSHAAAESTAF